MNFNNFTDITFIKQSANDNSQKSSTNQMGELYQKMIHLCDLLGSIERKIMDENILKIASLQDIKGCRDKTVEYIESQCNMLSLKVKRKMIDRVNNLYDSRKITPCQFDQNVPAQ